MRPLLPLLLFSFVAGAAQAAFADPSIHIAPYRPTMATPPAPASASATSTAIKASADDRAVKSVTAANSSVLGLPKSPRGVPQRPATPGMPAFSIHVGQDLVSALGTWLKSAGWSLDWQAQGASPGRLRHFLAEADWATRPASVQDLLRRTLAGLGVRAQVLEADKRVVVRNDNFSQE